VPWVRGVVLSSGSPAPRPWKRSARRAASAASSASGRVTSRGRS